MINELKQNIYMSGQSYGVALAYKPGNQEMLLCIHGLGCDKSSFEQIRQYSSLFPQQILLVDLLGFGASEQPMVSDQFSYTMAQQAQMLCALLNDFEFNKLSIVAHSMGGAVALSLPEILLASLHCFINVEGNLIEEDCFFSARMCDAGLAEFKTKKFPRFRQRVSDQAYVAEPLSRCSDEAFYYSAQDLVAASNGKQLITNYRQLSGRNIYVYGERNKAIPVLGVLAGNKLLEIADAGHFIMQDAPEIFYPKVAEMLALPNLA